jgi:hypothetical protein
MLLSIEQLAIWRNWDERLNSKDLLSKFKGKGVWVKINGNKCHSKQHNSQQDEHPAHEFFSFEQGKNPETRKSQCKNEKLKDHVFFDLTRTNTHTTDR